MAQIARSTRFLQKAEAALLSSIEVYNQPTFAYREETFSILALNAWELLVKGKLLAEHGNKPRCLYTFEKRTLKGGQLSTKLYLKKEPVWRPAYDFGIGKSHTNQSRRGSQDQSRGAHGDSR